MPLKYVFLTVSAALAIDIRAMMSIALLESLLMKLPKYFFLLYLVILVLNSMHSWLLS